MLGKLKGHVKTWQWDEETGKRNLELAKFIHPGLVGSILLKFGNAQPKMDIKDA